jgi:hypothetical protein
MTFTIRASKDGEIVETVRIGRTVTVAKARGLFKAGWMVQIIDSDGTPYAPSQFDHLLSFDPAKNDLQKTSSQDVTAPFAGDVLIEDQGGQRQQQPDFRE